MTQASGPTFFLPGFVASGDLSASQYKLVRLASTAGAVVLVDGDQTDIVLGVLYNDPTDGQAAEIAIGPVVKAQAEASLSAGDYVTGDTTGRLKATTTANDDVFGVLLEATVTAGHIHRVLVRGFNY
jgi:hypothetical protein